MPLMVAALTAKRSAVTRKLAAAARAGAVSADVRAELVSELTAESDARTSPEVARAVAFQTTKNFSNLSIVDQAVRGGFAVAPVRNLIGDAYWTALQAPHAATVGVAGFDDVRINISSGVYSTAGAATPWAGSATTEATKVVVTRITTTPPAGMAAAGPADPQMAAIVAAMKARLDADKPPPPVPAVTPPKAAGQRPTRTSPTVRKV
jgi:hypothetical protein